MQNANAKHGYDLNLVPPPLRHRLAQHNGNNCHTQKPLPHWRNPHIESNSQALRRRRWGRYAGLARNAVPGRRRRDCRLS